ncbi:MAG: SDR family oxidoreductase [Thaumarchaeota archaeon]|nr:SDR family oxidoreductase [Nitrososphaerota archaeon]
MIYQFTREETASTTDDVKKTLQTKNMLVTGGAGFIGSWICTILANLGTHIYCIDNLSTGLTENIAHLHGARNFHFENLDIDSSDPPKIRVDGILHLASRASPEDYQREPVETLLTNSVGTRNMLELARKNDAFFFYSSTSEVYGDPSIIPTPETYWGNVNPIGPRSCYDEGKRFGEALCMAYQRKYGLDIRITRIFNTYGPRLREDGAYARVTSRFIRQALTGQNITIYGDGKQTRSFCYITDTVTAILKTITNKKAKGQVINIGNPHETTILQLAQKIRQLTRSQSKIVYKPLPQDDPKRRCPDISKAKQLLNWQPTTSLQQGLEKTIEWLRSRLGKQF